VGLLSWTNPTAESPGPDIGKLNNDNNDNCASISRSEKDKARSQVQAQSTGTHELTSGMDATVAGEAIGGAITHGPSMKAMNLIPRGAWQVGSPFSDQDKPGNTDRGDTPWISAAWDCQSKKMVDCRWFGEGKEVRIKSSTGLV
jgi:glucose dehydrogenase